MPFMRLPPATDACHADLRWSSPRAQSPATELAAAVADLEHIRRDEQPTTRYLSLYSIPPDRRGDVAAVASYTLNALSRGRNIVRPKRITDTSCALTSTDYTTNKTETKEWLAAWEKIVELDPYWHIRTEVIAPVGNVPSVAFRPAPNGFAT